MSFAIHNSEQWKEVRGKIDMMEVGRALLGEPEEQSGNTFYWFCPFHGGSEPSLQISPGNFRWRCSCGKWGDAVDLVRCVRETTFSKALEFWSRPEFYRDEEDTHSEPLVFDGRVISGESIEVENDDWIDDLLRDAVSESE